MTGLMSVIKVFPGIAWRVYTRGSGVKSRAGGNSGFSAEPLRLLFALLLSLPSLLSYENFHITKGGSESGENIPEEGCRPPGPSPGKHHSLMRKEPEQATPHPWKSSFCLNHHQTHGVYSILLHLSPLSSSAAPRPR